MSSRAQWPPSARSSAGPLCRWEKGPEGQRSLQQSQKKTLKAHLHTQEGSRGCFQHGGTVMTGRHQLFLLTACLSWRTGAAVLLLWWRRSTGRTTASFFFHVFIKNITLTPSLGPLVTEHRVIRYSIRLPAPQRGEQSDNFSPPLNKKTMLISVDLSLQIGSLIGFVAMACCLNSVYSFLSVFVIRGKSSRGIRTSGVLSVYRWR